MFERMSESQFNQYRNEDLLIPVWGRIPASNITATSIFENLHNMYSRATFFESEEQGRYCFIGVDPSIHFESRGQMITLETKDGQISQFEADPLKTLRRLLQENKAIDLPEHSSLMGGAVGYFAYDSIRLFEKIPDMHPNENNLPDLLFNFYDNIIVLDKTLNTITVYVLVNVKPLEENAYLQAISEIEVLLNLIKKTKKKDPSLPSKITTNITVDIADEEFKKKVEIAKHHIHEGDIYQVVLSRTFRKKTEADPFDIFKALYQVNPSHWMFYFKEQDYQIAGASPERLITLKEGKLKINTLAGTIPRPESGEEQEKEQALLNDPKEIAEHMMLVDLGRNDIGSVSVVGSVKVTALKTILKLSHVIHISTVIEGRIDSNFDGLDAIRATLPAGTVSGAPKIRAMKIIDELENTRRGIYAGAICFIDNRGNIDSCLAIRTITIRNGIASVRTGAGIVHDSIPEKEANETKHKAKGSLKAIHLAEKGEL